MPSFEKILSDTPIGDIKPNPPYPVGTYLAVTTNSGEWGESRQKRTKQLQWRFKLLQPRPDVDQEKLMEWKDATGETVAGQEDYITFYDDSRAAKFLRDLGFDETVKGPEAIARSGGRQFLVKYRHIPSQNGQFMVRDIAESAAV
jgi:hypothetical protein